jgi:hypothetical protein
MTKAKSERTVVGGLEIQSLINVNINIQPNSGPSKAISHSLEPRHAAIRDAGIPQLRMTTEAISK